MTIRLDERRPAPVPARWRRGRNRLAAPLGPRAPEPRQLYSLIVLTLVVHAARMDTDTCEHCGAAWPCEPVRLAYRLREGF